MKELITICGRDFIPVTKVMAQLGISYKTLNTWIKNDTFPRPIKLGRRLYVERDEVDASLLSQTT